MAAISFHTRMGKILFFSIIYHENRPHKWVMVKYRFLLAFLLVLTNFNYYVFKFHSSAKLSTNILFFFFNGPVARANSHKIILFFIFYDVKINNIYRP